MKNPELTQQRDERRARLLNMKRTMTLEEIGKLEGVSRARIGQIIGRTTTAGMPRSNRILEVYRFIEWFTGENRYAPTVDEIAHEFRDRHGNPSSRSVVAGWLQLMEQWGMIAPRPPRIARAIVTQPLNRKQPEIRELLRLEKEIENG